MNESSFQTYDKEGIWLESALGLQPGQIQIEPPVPPEKANAAIKQHILQRLETTRSGKLVFAVDKIIREVGLKGDYRTARLKVWETIQAMRATRIEADELVIDPIHGPLVRTYPLLVPLGGMWHEDEPIFVTLMLGGNR